MRENFDQWPYIIAAYSIAIAATIGLAAWSWFKMYRAEQRRERSRRKP